jgi:hypothetical protein
LVFGGRKRVSRREEEIGGGLGKKERHSFIWRRKELREGKKKKGF